MKKFKVLDLFSGCGGLSLGFQDAGFEISLAIDNWADALQTFHSNHPNAKTLCEDLTKVDFPLIKNQYLNGEVDIVIGGPPCQGFSISGKRDPRDPRNKLSFSFIDAVKFLKPKAFVMENVPNFASMDGGKIKDKIILEFESMGYLINFQKMLASDYGVPQNRRRFFIVGLLERSKYDFPKGSTINEKVTTFEAISDLPENSLNDGSQYPLEASSDYQRLMRRNSNEVHNHMITDHTEKTKSIIALVPDGGNYKDLPQSLKNTRRVNIAWTRYDSRKPSFTIDTGHRHHFHYSFNRVPTVRESARLQSFPDDFIFKGSKTSQYKQVGNAVPPILSKAIATQLLKHLPK